MRPIGLPLALALAMGAGWAQTSDPAYEALDRAYKAQREKNYDDAIGSFRTAIAASPKRADIHKNLAYTLLKTGDTEAARDEFAAAMQIDPTDEHVALEYAFLCYETRQQAIARRTFARIRKTGNATAEQAFQNIDRPLAAGIERWKQVLATSPDNFSAHNELAILADQRDDLPLAAEHYEKAWRLKTGETALLLALGRVWKALGRDDQAGAALLAASRGAEVRASEAARELLPARYPYVYEFQKALEFDPKSVGLRRELAYLLLEMNKPAEAENEFRALHELVLDDLVAAAQLGLLHLARNDRAGAQPLLDQVLKGNDEDLAVRVRAALKMPQTLQHRPETARPPAADEAKQLAKSSIDKGYMKDALKYLKLAHEADPLDFWVMLKLGWAYNMLHDDGQAIQWFKMARASPDAAIAKEAAQAYGGLHPALARFRTTVWLFPFFSSRWKDAFAYGQIKTEMRMGKLPFRLYLSTRFIGDAKEQEGSAPRNTQPQYLSESSFIFGIGLVTRPWRGITGWGEAGEAVKYLASRKDVGAMIPDYRGGLSYAKGFGHLLNGSKGLFFENNEDGVFVSRFQNDSLIYSQNRAGYTLPALETGGLKSQVYWNFNGTAVRLGQYWANYVETGPGFRFHVDSMPKSLMFSVNWLRGVYTINDGNPRRPNFFDLRAGFWYAFTH